MQGFCMVKAKMSAQTPPLRGLGPEITPKEGMSLWPT